MMGMKLEVGCDGTEGMMGRVNGMWFCRFKIFRMRG